MRWNKLAAAHEKKFVFAVHNIKLWSKRMRDKGSTDRRQIYWWIQKKHTLQENCFPSQFIPLHTRQFCISHNFMSGSLFQQKETYSPICASLLLWQQIFHRTMKHTMVKIHHHTTKKNCLKSFCRLLILWSFSLFFLLLHSFHALKEVLKHA